MAIQIEFTKEELHLLWHTACASFVIDDPDRFDFIPPKGMSGEAVLRHIIDAPLPVDVGTLVFFESFVDAKLFQAAYLDFYPDRACYLVFDSGNDEYAAWLEVGFEIFNEERLP